MAKQTLNPDEPTVRVDLFVPTSMKKAIVDHSLAQGIPISQVIRDAIAMHVARK